MTAPLAKFEDWKAPWEVEGQEFDPEKAKKYQYGLLSDKERLQTSVAEKDTQIADLTKQLEDKAREGETEADKQRREVAEAQAKADRVPTLEAENLKLQVALEKGLTAVQAKRLIGSTKEELEKDADELVASFGGTGKVEEEGDEPDSLNRQPRRRVNPADPDPDGGDEISIDKALELIPRIN